MNAIESVFNRLVSATRQNPYPDVSHRISQLRALRKVLTSDIGGITKAMQLDFGKPYSEILLTEIVTVVHEIDFHVKKLKSWMKPTRVRGSLLTFPSRSKIYPVPFGVCLIIGAWNYPIHLSLMPLIGAISAGNRVVLKPSEIAPETSAWIKKQLQGAMDPETIQVIEGGVDVTQELLTLPFGKIFFTGSTRVGRIVMQAAAQHLTPVTLELGGKSPAILFDDANMYVSAKRIWFGKCINAGQTCVAPDYVLVPEEQYDAFISASRKVLSELYPDGFKAIENYTNIINTSHFDRLQALLTDALVVVGGNMDRESAYMEPIIVKVDNWNHPLMQEEIFGPILPILTYRTEEELNEHLSHSVNPLACYLFTESEKNSEKWIRQIPFGGGCVNDTLSHLVNPRLPFGGVGTSGMGGYHGKTSFDVFSHSKSVLKRNTWFDTSLRYQPFNKLNRIVEFLIK